MADTPTQTPKPTTPSTPSTPQQDPAKAPDPQSLAGTSRQPSNDKQENNQQLNPDMENAAGNAAAPGVTPTNKVNQDPAPSKPEDAQAGNEPEPHKADPKDSLVFEPKREYRLVKGKHRYTNDAGEEVIAREGDLVPLTQTQFDALRDRFERPHND